MKKFIYVVLTHEKFGFLPFFTFISFVFIFSSYFITFKFQSTTTLSVFKCHRGFYSLENSFFSEKFK